ncbi:MAG: hypothetical protein ACR2L0_08830 [Gaiellaceae bacterium]
MFELGQCKTNGIAVDGQLCSHPLREREFQETRASLEEATAVLGLLAMLEGRRARSAARALADLLDTRALMPAAEVLVRWAGTSD